MRRVSSKGAGAIWLTAGLVIVAAAFLLLYNPPKSNADRIKTWGDLSKSIVVSNGQTPTDYQYNQFLRSHEDVAGDKTCEQKAIALGPESSGFGSYNGCWYDTSLGLIESGGYFVKPKSQPYAGLVNNAESRLLPTGNPNVFAEVTNPSRDYVTYFLNFRTASDGQMEPTDPSWGVPFYSWTAPAEHSLMESDGLPWPVSDDLVASQIGYSNNGRWMSIWDDRGFVMVVNLQNFTSRIITVEPQSVAKTDEDFATTTTSDDGRYLAVGVFGRPAVIFDLTSCTTSPEPAVGGAEECNARFLGPPLSDFTSGETDISSLPHFYSDDLLGTYARCPVGVPGFSSYCEYLFRAPNTGGTNYIALGDSYASGEGEGNLNFYTETDIHDVNMCHLAKNSYPFLIGREAELNSAHSVACSGAKILNLLGNGVFDSSLSNPNRTNQYKEIASEDLGSWSPGYHEQIRFVKENRPSIVTVSIGGNDIGFKDMVERCLEPGTCYQSYEDRLELVNLINQQFDRLVNLYSQLKQNTLPDARIYVIGYPSIVKPGGDCGLNVLMNSGETKFTNDLEDYLNSVIKLAAEKAGATYVDTTDVFNGHRLCDLDEKAMNGITFGHDSKIILSNGSFHPTVYGHELLAEQIENLTKNFTTPMPRANPTILNPVADPGLEFLQADKSGRSIYEVAYVDVTTNQLVYRGGNVDVAYVAPDAAGQLKPYSSVDVELHSDPVHLDSLTTDENGNFEGSLKIPHSIPPGFHALDFYALGADGKIHDITQTIYVTDPPMESGEQSASVGIAASADILQGSESHPDKLSNASGLSDIELASDEAPAGQDQAVEIANNPPATSVPNDTRQVEPWLLIGVLVAGLLISLLTLIGYARRKRA